MEMRLILNQRGRAGLRSVRDASETRPTIGRGMRRGAVTVEFALTAPIALLMVFAIMEFGRCIMALHGIEHAAREGCRIAIRWQATAQATTQTVATCLRSYHITDYALQLEPAAPSSASQWEPVTVRISVPYRSLSWLPLPRYLGGLTLRGSCTLPKESED